MFSFKIIPRTFDFQFDARTSRGALKQKKSWFILLSHSDFPDRTGIGECGPLPGLSPENLSDFEDNLIRFSKFVLPFLDVHQRCWDRLSSYWLENWEGPWLPSVVFGWETAWLDWVNGGKRLICDPFFWSGNGAVSINGLVWMNDFETMLSEARNKIYLGYSTIKIKVGSLEWNQELDLLGTLRADFGFDKIAIRLDANGAWTPEEAQEKLKDLIPYRIHSIEQPIKPGNPSAMAALCRESPIPIALDEELIGHFQDYQKYSLLDEIQPPFLVLKPSLVGGLGQTHQWIKMAEDFGADWWITSMLESNIGLNAISQLAAQYHPILPQGLGTGSLYLNNLDSPLEIKEGKIFCNPSAKWNTDSLL